MKSFALIFALLTSFTLALPAQAQDDQPFSFGSQPGWQIMGGLTGGGSFGSPGGGGFVGLELSANRLQKGLWWGVYVDGSYDFGHTAVMTTAGPEIGYGLFGLDGGVAARFGTGSDNRGDVDFGPQGRVLLTAGFVGIFGRYVYMLDSDEHIGQAGLLLKLPLWAN